MKQRYKVLIFILGVVLSQASYSTSMDVTLDINSGILAGINNVNVDGVLFDASFNNTFAEADSQFSTQLFATAASVELKSLFTTMTAFSPFLSNPLLINGCDIGNFQTNCILWTGVAINSEGQLAGTGASIDNDNTRVSNYGFGPKGGNAQNLTYTNWSPAVVPLPATVFLFLPAILGLFGYRCRQKVS